MGNSGTINVFGFWYRKLHYVAYVIPVIVRVFLGFVCLFVFWSFWMLFVSCLSCKRAVGVLCNPKCLCIQVLQCVTMGWFDHTEFQVKKSTCFKCCKILLVLFAFFLCMSSLACSTNCGWWSFENRNNVKYHQNIFCFCFLNPKMALNSLLHLNRPIYLWHMRKWHVLQMTNKL